MIYWAGDRGFRACTRWHDREAIKILRKEYGWEVFYPFDGGGEHGKGFFGKRGRLRETCLEGIKQSSAVVAYLGSYDTGTAQEIEYALALGKAILAWSDSALIVGQHSGREVALDQGEVEELKLKAFPMNGMTPVFDRYVEFSSFEKDVGPRKLAEIINRELGILLQQK